jgi:hypothetical protein
MGVTVLWGRKLGDQKSVMGGSSAWSRQVDPLWEWCSRNFLSHLGHFQGMKSLL